MINIRNIENYIAASRHDFIRWQNVLLKYENELSGDFNFEKKFSSPLYKEIFLIFAELVYTITQNSATNEEWSTPSPDWQPTGIIVSTESKKTNIKISFALYENEFFLETFLINAKDLNKVSDNFWFNILKLRNYGRLEFEGEPIDKVYNSLNIEKRYRTTSNIFRLIKNFIFLDLTNGNLVNLAAIQIKWDRNSSWEEIIRNGCYCFELLYKINKEICSKDKSRNLSEF